MRVSIPTVGDLVGSSPEPSSAALSETSSPVLPFSPEEERIAVMRELRAGEGVLGTKSQGGERKKVEEEESGESMYGDGTSLEEKGEGGNYSHQEEEPIVHISKAPGSTTDKLLPPDNRRHLHDQANRDSTRSSLSTLTAEELWLLRQL